MKAALSLTIFIGMLSGFAGSSSCEATTLSVRPPQFAPPAPGTTLNQSFEIALDAMPTADCVSVVQEQATILISRRLLEHLRAAKPGKWTSEEERLALIRGSRAEGLLQDLTKSIDSFMCSKLATPVSSESLYLISELLQSGQVAVIDNHINQCVRHIVVNFSGLVAGPLAGIGHISYSFTEQSAPFLRLIWWQS
jgi:hypothetical protein